MTVIVTDAGFTTDDWTAGFTPLDEAPANDNALAIDVSSDASPESMNSLLEVPLIRIDFPSFADGRGFTLAAILRRNGYKGRLRAKGHVIADQYAMARRSGFDEVEIDDDLASRQPEDQWIRRANWQAHNYQAKMRG